MVKLNYYGDYDVTQALSEDNLEEYLRIIFPEVNDWQRNKKLAGYFPDYYSPSLQMVIEYNGPLHYTDSRTIYRDSLKKAKYESVGLKVIEIPNFIQLDSKTVKILFNKDVEIKRKYPHGFISKLKTMKVPADFCELGVYRFEEDLKRFGREIAYEIYENLLQRAEDMNLPHWVILSSNLLKQKSPISLEVFQGKLKIKCYETVKEIKDCEYFNIYSKTIIELLDNGFLNLDNNEEYYINNNKLRDLANSSPDLSFYGFIINPKADNFEINIKTVSNIDENSLSIIQSIGLPPALSNVDFEVFEKLDHDEILSSNISFVIGYP